LPQWYHPTLKSGTFAKVTDDGFFISIECADAAEVEKATAFLNQIGAVGVESLEE
jgi:hypothetical protein